MGSFKYATNVKKNTLSPKWKDEFFEVSLFLKQFIQAVSYLCILLTESQDPRETGKPGPGTQAGPYKNRKTGTLVGPKRDPTKTGKPGPIVGL